MTDSSKPSQEQPAETMSRKVPGSGRKKGTPNKVTKQLREIAQPYALEALDKLVELMRTTKNEELRRRVCVDIIERAYGKPATTSEVTVNGERGMMPPILQFAQVAAKAPEHPDEDVLN